MVDNIKLIIPFINSETTDDFYYLQILQRKKENSQLGSNSRVIKNYYIRSVDHLLEHYDEIKALCVQFNARASIRLNKRSFESVAFKTLENIANSMRNREYKFIKASYDRACGLGHNDKEKKWILDIDEDMTYQDIQNLDETLEKLPPEGTKILAFIPSKSGMHVITKPFDCNNFSKLYPNIEIHKDNPTNLFIP